MTRSRTCLHGCDHFNDDLTETQKCNEDDCCIEYRTNLQCIGDIVWQTSEASSTLSYTPTFQSPEGYGRCASSCISLEGVVAFNWINRGIGLSTCECLRMVFFQKFSG